MNILKKLCGNTKYALKNAINNKLSSYTVYKNTVLQIVCCNCNLPETTTTTTTTTTITTTTTSTKTTTTTTTSTTTTKTTITIITTTTTTTTTTTIPTTTKPRKIKFYLTPWLFHFRPKFPKIGPKKLFSFKIKKMKIKVYISKVFLLFINNILRYNW